MWRERCSSRIRPSGDGSTGPPRSPTSCRPCSGSPSRQWAGGESEIGEETSGIRPSRADVGRSELAVLLEPAVDRPPRDAERAGRFLLVVVEHRKRAKDQVLLHFGQRGERAV